MTRDQAITAALAFTIAIPASVAAVFLGAGIGWAICAICGVLA